MTAMPSPAGVRRAAGAIPGGTAISRLRIFFGQSVPARERYGVCGRLSAYDAEPERR
ncbi:hypothetical protein GCM10009872_45630 [Actinopolymorpha rutila]